MKTTKFEEGIDYYIEDGNYVFTEHYLLKRGYCCQHRCRHCPYEKKHKTKNDKKNNVNGIVS